jgi:hypothetical protein
MGKVSHEAEPSKPQVLNDRATRVRLQRGTLPSTAS